MFRASFSFAPGETLTFLSSRVGAHGLLGDFRPAGHVWNLGILVDSGLRMHINHNKFIFGIYEELDEVVAHET